MDGYMKDKMVHLTNDLKCLFNELDQENEDKQIYRALLNSIEYMLTVGYVKNRDKSIYPGYALEKLRAAKFNLDWAIEEFKSQEEEQDETRK